MNCPPESPSGSIPATHDRLPDLHCLHWYFEARAAGSPDRTALTTGDGQSLTYDELNRLSNRIAHALAKTALQPGGYVGICLDRDALLPAAILGVLKAGAAYVPVDSSYPADRLAFMLEDAMAPVLLTTREMVSALPDYAGAILLLDDPAVLENCPEENPGHSVNPEQICHVIYTSGSTGMPKGCAVSHRSVVRLLQALEPSFAMNREDVWTLFHSTAFDFSVWELWGALLYGARLVVVPWCVSRSPADFLSLLEKEKVTLLNQTPSAFRQLMQAEEQAPVKPRLCLRHIMLGGEAIDVHSLMPWFERHGGTCPQIHNMYGPTETTVFATMAEINWDQPGAPCTIGRPLPGTTIHFLDENHQPVPAGSPGEIVISGPGVAVGYLNRDDLNAARFLPDPWTGAAGSRMYTSGDLGRLLPDGTIEYMGRIDQQVKLHGFRIELGEIESRLLTFPGIREAAVLLRVDHPGHPRLCAYLIAVDGPPGLEALRVHLRKQLPDYMVPAAFVFMDRFPITTNGKLDRRALLPPPHSRSTASSAEFVAPRTPMEESIAAVWAELLGLDEVGATDHFFELGGSSVLMVRAGPLLRERLRRPVSMTDLFKWPTVRSLAAHLTDSEPVPSAVATKKPECSGDGSIAIVGMAGRFPEAPDLETFWENLVANRDVITRFRPGEIAAHEPVRDPAYQPCRGILDRPDWWDAAFFSTSPREAEAMDPQQRVFMEEAWHALENAACDPGRFKGLIGVYAGLSNNSYYGSQVEFNRELRTALGAETIMLGNEKDYLATRTAHKLNLHGPALNVYTACSTSLTAVCLAVQSLRSGACDMALAGGVTIKFPQDRGYVFQEGSLYSRDGLCRSFDADAAGTVFSNGVGVVVLKRLADALRDGDTIHAVIKAAVLNNDGASRVSFTAPNPAGQAAVIRAAHAEAGTPPETIGYIEAHGTATPLGDPIEIAGLTEAFRSGTSRTGFCAVSSLKSHTGHMDVTAGVAGLIKTVLSLKNELLPATLHFKAPSPALGLEDSPFYIVSENTPWPRGVHPRRAGVSAFGLGGTNAHAVLEEAPELPASSPASPNQMLVLSAKSAEALQAMAAGLAHWLQRHPDSNLADVAWTLQTGRKAFNHRLAVTASSTAEAASLLGEPEKWTAAPLRHTGLPVAFIFPGQGSQHIRMAAGLYAHESEFTSVLDHCCDLLTPLLGIDLRTLLFPEPGHEQSATALLNETRYTQPALFVVEYAMASQLMAWGIEPGVMLGHSIGEYTAACLAGVFQPADALRVVAARGRLMGECAPGAMLAVKAPPSEVERLLPDTLEIAACNAPLLTVVSGPAEACAAFAELLESKEIPARKIHTSHAFHSSMMEPALEAFRAVMTSVPLSPPQRPYISNVTGRLILDSEAMDPDYYVKHLRNPVRFADGVAAIMKSGPCVLLETGPGQALNPLMKQHPATAAATAILATLPAASTSPASDSSSLFAAITRLWMAGVEIAWEQFHAGQNRRRLPLPGYPFQRQRFCPDFTLPANWERDSMSNLLVPDGFLAGKSDAPDAATPTAVASAAVTPPAETAAPADAPADAASAAPPRIGRILAAARTELTRISGIDLKTAPPGTSFFDLGFDSLSLTQSSLNLKKVFGLPVTMRQLSEELGSLEKLSQWLDAQLPPAAFAAPSAAPQLAAVSGPDDGNPVKQRLAGIERGIAELRAILTDPPAPADSNAGAWTVKVEHQNAGGHGAVSFGPFRPLQTSKDGSLTARQQQHLDKLMEAYIAKHRKSRDYTQKHRAHFADPRAVSGFNHLWKEAVFPIVTNRSKGAMIQDIDGNQFIDITLGFGPAFLGHSPDFVVDAVRRQLELGFEIGPTHELAGEVAELLLEFTGMDRVGFCNTGSEAVMAALRMARTVSGRDKIVTFAGDYHGTFDEVLIRPVVVDGHLRTVPLAPGIPENIGANILVLDYGNPESLEIIRQQAGEIAAVLVETVRSRDPGLQPVDFLRELREITAASGTALVFDEIVTGFRSHPKGAQGYFGIQADIATYGKVVGGGIPIGLVAGKRQYMDALDGGHWQYGDASGPEVGVTFFAGTFVRHPLALAAAKAVLLFLKEQGPALQEKLTRKTTELVRQLNTIAAEAGVPLHIGQFTSFFYPVFAPGLKYTEPFFHHMRLRGIHVWSARPWFLSIAHTAEDIAAIVQAFRESVAAMQEAGFFPSPGPEPGTWAPVTPAQQEIFLASKFNPEMASACHESMALRISGPIGVHELQRALRLIIQRHDSLCAVVSEDGSRLVFTSLPEVPVPFEDLSGSGPEAFDDLWDREFTAPFDLATGPLIRARLVRVSDEEQQLLLTAHHMVCDGWSFGILAGELPWALQTIAGENPPALPAPDEFAAFARHQDEQRKSGAFERDRKFWLDRYKDLPASLELPCDHPRPSEPSPVTAPAFLRLAPELSRKLHDFCRSRRLTPYTVLLAAWEILLHRLSGSRDFTVGVPVAGQIASGLSGLCGHAVQFLPVRAELDPEVTALDFLIEVKSGILDAQEHQNFTLGELLEQRGGLSGEARRNFAATAFSLEPMMPSATAAGLTVEPVLGYKRRSFFELTLYAFQDKDGFLLLCAYRRELYEAGTVDRWLSHYKTLLEGILDHPDTPVGNLPLLNPVQLHEILHGFNSPRCSPFPETTVPALVEQEAICRPEATALEWNGGRLSYHDLNARANQLAHGLKGKGVLPGSIVPVLMERSQEFVISLLGILKAGAAYLPIDPHYPVSRINLLLVESGATFVIGQDVIPHPHAHELVCPVVPFSEIPTGDPAQPPAIPADPARPAYLIYTSGSTGTPKGVVIPHKAIVRLVRETDYATLNETRVHLLASSVSFDASTFEIWGALCTGARLAILPAGGFSLASLAETIRRHKVTTLWLTAGLFQLMVDEHLEDLRGVSEILTGGDVVPLSHVRKAMAALPETRFINGYGPTENTTFSACHTITPSDLQRPSLPIGRPIAHSTAFVLDARLQPVPIGVPGELFCGGEGLADGYWNQPGPTAAAFIPHPFSGKNGDRLYRTGDLVRWLPGGILEFAGRLDHQIKIRGFRIEPAEVEAQLAVCPGIHKVCAAAHGHDAGSRKLIAWFVPALGPPPDLQNLRQWASDHLPAWMVPSHFIPVPEFPLTPNGKIDYRALPAPSARPSIEFQQVSRTLTPTEKQLATLWSNVLGHHGPGPDSDFFESGGTSLLGLRLVSGIQHQFKIALPLSTLFRSPQLGQLAAAIDAHDSGRPDSSLVCLQPHGDLPPLICLHGGDGGALFYRKILGHLDEHRPIYTLEAPALFDPNIPVKHQSITEAAAAYLQMIHDVLPDGPCVLAGFSYGGLVAWELACQMETSGTTRPLVVLLDTSNPTAPAIPRSLPERSALVWKNQSGKPLRERLAGISSRIGSRLKGMAGLDLTKTEALRLLDSGQPTTDPLIRREQLLHVHTTAMENYRPTPWPGTAVLLRTTAIDDKFILPEDYGWTSLAGKLVIHPIEGDHLELFEEPQVHLLGETFARVLKQEGLHPAAKTHSSKHLLPAKSPETIQA